MTNPFAEILDKIEQLAERVASIGPVTMPRPHEIIDTKELCRRLGISEPTLVRWRKKKKIPYFEVGNCVRYNWPSVVEFLESKKSTK